MKQILLFLKSIPVWLRSLRRIPFERGEILITLKQPLVLVVFGLSLIWYLMIPGEVSAMLTAGLGSILLGSYLWARQMALRVRCSRRLRYSAFQVGDQMEEHITLTNGSFLPVLWAEFIDHSSVPSYSITSVRAAGGGEIIEWNASTLCAQRGLYRLGPWEIWIGEPFGIFNVYQRYDEHNEIIVYPPLAPLPDTLLPYSNALGSQRRLRQPLPSETNQATTTRPYQPGDALRRIHWKTTARRDAPFVKVFEPEASTLIWIVPDFDASVHRGEGPESSLEMMIILAASLAAHLLQERLAVGMLFKDGRGEAVSVIPGSGRAHLWNILRALAPVQTTPMHFEEALSVIDRLVTGQDMIIAITPSLRPEWPLALKEMSHGARTSHSRAILLDAQSFAAGKADPTPEKEPPLPIEQNSLSYRRTVSGMLAYLASLNIPAAALGRADIHPILGAHGALRRWEFKTLGTGRVVVTQAPRETPAQREASARPITPESAGGVEKQP